MSLKRKKSFKGPLFVILLLLLAGTGGAGYLLFFEGKAPVITTTALPEYLGLTDTLSLTINDEGSGIRRVEIFASQKNKTKQLFATENPRTGYIGTVGPTSMKPTISFDAKALGFKDGEIVITVKATDFSFRGMLSGNNTEVNRTLTLDSKPPKLRILHSERYVRPGGSGIVIYQNSDGYGAHGVVINGKLYQGYPVSDTRKDTYISYFALPFDTTNLEISVIRAQDAAGNRSIIPLAMTFTKIRFKKDTITVTDSFLRKKLPEFEQRYDNLQGNLKEKYLFINRTIRKENNADIGQLCTTPEQDRHWEGRFLRMAGRNCAGFADHRTYFYQGQEIDRQVHLGIDLASTKQANIKAANTGKVIFADYKGIYGNMIILDHGQGVFSLYSHLSQINVAKDDMVTKGDVIGLTGISGMAGGDHLHFSMLIHGVFVTPKEWWDPAWIETRIEQPLVDTGFEGN